MENVLTRPAAWRHMSATTVEESVPPERKAPSGTSDSRWDVTAASSLRRKFRDQLTFIAQTSRPGAADSSSAVPPPRAPDSREEVPGGKLAHTLEDAVRVRHIAEREVLHDRARSNAQSGTIESVQRA